MKGLRIIFTVTNDLTFDRRMFRICTTLAEADAEVILVGRKLKESLSFVPAKFKTKRLNCFFRKGPLFYAEYNVRLFIYLLTTQFDIACACDLDTALAVRLASAMKGKIAVYDAHEYFTEVPELTGRPVIRNFWDFIAKVTIPGFDLRYTVGEELAALMGKKYDSLFHVIRNIPSENQRNSEPKKIENLQNILLYQGALNLGRGLEATLEAMKNLPQWEFWLAGEGDIADRLKSLAKQYGIENRIKFLGWIFSYDLPALMQNAKLGINLREAGSLNDYYSLPNKFFDFIHAGLPSINMNYPEYARVCAAFPCAILIDKVSSGEIVKAIHDIENNPGEYNKMVEACHFASLEFTWLHESNKLISLYNEVITV